MEAMRRPVVRYQERRQNPDPEALLRPARLVRQCSLQQAVRVQHPPTAAYSHRKKASRARQAPVGRNSSSFPVITYSFFFFFCVFSRCFWLLLRRSMAHQALDHLRLRSHTHSSNSSHNTFSSHGRQRAVLRECASAPTLVPEASSASACSSACSAFACSRSHRCIHRCIRRCIHS